MTHVAREVKWVVAPVQVEKWEAAPLVDQVEEKWEVADQLGKWEAARPAQEVVVPQGRHQLRRRAADHRTILVVLVDVQVLGPLAQHEVAAKVV